MVDGSAIAVLIRTDGAPSTVPSIIVFRQPNSSISVGRAENNQVVLNDKKISKAHALLTLRTCKRKGASDGEVMRRVFIKDSSTFGTFLNGKALKKGEWTIINEADIVGLRNPHGNPSGGEYSVQYQQAPALLAAAVERGESPVDAVAASADAAAAAAGVAKKTKSLPQPKQASQVKEELGAQVEATRTVARPAPPAQVQEPASPASLVSDPGDEEPVAKKRPPPLSTKREAAKEESDAIEEPLSPLSEVSEVSAPGDEAPAAPTMPTLGMPPGLIPGMAPPGMIPGMMPGMFHGMPMMAGMPGLPPHLMPMVPGMPFGFQMMQGMMQGLQVPSGPVPNAALPGSKAAKGETTAIAVAATPVVMNIGAEFVGTLIGRGGEVVKQLSKDSGARIEISKTAGDGSSGERTVHISGTQECIDRAKKMIEDCIEKAKEKTGGNNPNACTLRVPHDLIGMLIGRGGETIKELKKESGARIDILKEPVDDGSTDRPADRVVNITGPPECVEYAKKMIEEMLGKRVKEESDDRDRRSQSPGGELVRATTAVLHVHNDLIGMLIGKGGETIRTISKDFSVRIEIVKETEGCEKDERAVKISGAPDGVERARRHIEDTLSGSREGKGVRRIERETSNRSSSGGGRAIQIPNNMIGVLIGRGGETISRLQRDTKARIEIAKDDGNSSDRNVIISGSPDAIEKAVEAVEAVLSEAERSGRVPRRQGRGDQLSLPAPGDDFDRKDASPVKDSYLCEKVYIDEVDMIYRPNFLPEHEDGLLTDLEIFVRGLPKVLAERDLWEHLFRLGCGDVKEILLLRRQKQSKGMAYVVFNRHDHAVMAKQKLHNAPANSIPCATPVPPEETGVLAVRFSESERCINGRSNAYGMDLLALLLGSRGKCMQQVKDESGLRKVILTGRGLKAFGQVDEDPRLHMVVYYEPDEGENVVKALKVWAEQLGGAHREIADKGKGKGGFKGKGKGWPEWDPLMPPLPMWDGRPPPLLPPMGPIPEPPVEAPVLLKRRKLEAVQDGEAPQLTGEKIMEVTSLKGRELRWQPWPEVSQFNADWKVTPLRWGLQGELFVLLRKRDTGETKVCAAEVQNPVEKWPVLFSDNSGSAPSKMTRYKSFTFNEHLFIISIDRDTGKLKVSHVPDPSSAWNTAYETTLDGEGLPLSRSAKLTIFYTNDRTPYVLVQEPNSSGDGPVIRVFRIADPAKPWKLCNSAPALNSRARLLTVYTKARGSPNRSDFETAVFAVDPATQEIVIWQVPIDLDRPWSLLSKVSAPGDTRLSCIYVPGKPEPLLMAGSPTEKMQKLCHLNLVEWRIFRQDERLPPPKGPAIEDKFSRPMSSLWPENSREGHDPQTVVALPMDCTADLPVSRHIWSSTPVLPPPIDLAPPMGLPPPLGAPYGPPPVPFGPGPPPGMPPPFGPPTPFGRPPFERPPPWFGPPRPPFDHPPHARPPFDGLPPHPLPPFERPPMPFNGPRPPFEGARPPFEAPPGDWFGNKGMGKGPPGMPPPGMPPPGAPPVAGGWPEIGTFVEANSLQKNQWLRAKVILQHPDGSCDVEYDGDYMEWLVPASRIRPLPEDNGEGRRRRHRHRRGGGEEGAEGTEGRRRRRERGEEGEAGNAEASTAPASTDAQDGQATDAPPAEGGNPEGENAEQERKRHRRHRHKDRSQSQDGERKHRRRRRKEGEEANEGETSAPQENA